MYIEILSWWLHLGEPQCIHWGRNRMVPVDTSSSQWYSICKAKMRFRCKSTWDGNMWGPHKVMGKGDLSLGSAQASGCGCPDPLPPSHRDSGWHCSLTWRVLPPALSAPIWHHLPFRKRQCPLLWESDGTGSNLCQLACCMVLVSTASPPLRKSLRSFRWLMRPTSVLLEVSVSGYLPQHHLRKQVKVQVLWLRLSGGWAPEPALKSAPPGDPYACRAWKPEGSDSYPAL